MTSPRPAGGGRAEQPRSRRPAHVSLAYRPAIDGLRAIAVVAVSARGLAARLAGDGAAGFGALAMRGLEFGAAGLVLLFGVGLLLGYIAAERVTCF